MKKAQLDLQKVVVAISIVAVAMLISLSFIVMHQTVKARDRLEEKCNKLGLELFDYSGGGLFSSESYSCWNPITKEVKLIK
jgi:hypothetical protein